MRKIGMNRLIRGEKGYILITALLVLVVVGLISGPVLSYMVSGLRAGHVFETGAAELYAADAGVEDAVLRIPNLGLCQAQNTAHYTISDVNGKSVNVTITYVNNTTETVTYRVESTATSDSSGTKIDAYISGDAIAGDFSGITNNVITSLGGIKYFGQVNVDPPEGEEHGPQDYYGGDWPTAEELCDWYWWDVQDATHYSSDTTIDLNGVSQSLGPLYVDGELTIKNSGGSATLTLTGTIYATGDTLIGTTGKTFTLGLNGSTIFVASATAGSQKALDIGGKCSMDGSGTLIAVGDTYFAPDGNIGSEEGPVLTLSVLGSTLLQPSGNFYGTVAGNVTVDVKSGEGQNLIYPDTGFGVINFPGCIAGRFIYSIASWEVSRQ
jgi:Tfp pilus assembly protein PilX